MTRKMDLGEQGRCHFAEQVSAAVILGWTVTAPLGNADWLSSAFCEAESQDWPSPWAHVRGPQKAPEPLSASFPEVRSLSLVASSPQYSLAPAPESPPVTRLPLGREYATKLVSSTSFGKFHLILEKCTELSCYDGRHSLLHFSVTCLFSPRSPFPCACGNQAEK